MLDTTIGPSRHCGNRWSGWVRQRGPHIRKQTVAFHGKTSYSFFFDALSWPLLSRIQIDFTVKMAGSKVDKPGAVDFVSFAFEAQRAYPADKPLFIDAQDPGRSLNYAQTRSLVRKLISGLKASGLGKGDRVLLSVANNVRLPSCPLFFDFLLTLYPWRDVVSVRGAAVRHHWRWGRSMRRESGLEG